MPSPQDKSVIGTVKSKKGISLDMNREYLPYPGIERERERERERILFNFPEFEFQFRDMFEEEECKI